MLHLVDPRLSVILDTIDIIKPERLDAVSESLYFDLAFLHGFMKGEMGRELAAIFKSLELYADPKQVAMRFQMDVYGQRWSRYDGSGDRAMSPEEVKLLMTAFEVQARIGVLLD